MGERTFAGSNQKRRLSTRRIISANMLMLEHHLCGTEVAGAHHLEERIAQRTKFITDIAHTNWFYIPQGKDWA